LEKINIQARICCRWQAGEKSEAYVLASSCRGPEKQTAFLPGSCEALVVAAAADESLYLIPAAAVAPSQTL
jgi:hypothetical protein